MQFQPPQGRTTRANFERELYLLVEQLQQGRLKFSEATMLNSLQAIRLVPNRRIDLNTIGSSVRAMALITVPFAERADQDPTEFPTP